MKNVNHVLGKRTCVLYNGVKGGSDLLNTLERSFKHNQLLEMIYCSTEGKITKRRIRVIKIRKYSFIAYCYLRKSFRTFKMNQVLAVVPVQTKSRMVN